MVDKIDKPEAPPTYAVTHPTETKREKPREEKGQEDLPTFKKQDASIYREKFQMEGGTLKTIRVPIDQIKNLLFRRATPRHGTPMAEADLIWRDGRKTDGISFLLHNWQDFLKIKNLKQGEIIAQSFWNDAGNVLEITIRQGPTSGPWNLRQIEGQAEGPIKPTQTVSWWQKRGVQLSLYGLGFLSFLILILFLITRS